jgi:hypothetical protein
MNINTYDLSTIPGFYYLIKLDTNIDDSHVLKLNKIECLINNCIYKVIRYNKNLLCFDFIETFGKCRSIIVNSANKVVCFSPPKSIPADIFIKKYPEFDKKNCIIAEEFIEGTMINVFFDPTIDVSGNWEISTRNNVGATTSFYKSKNSKTFRQMFMEAAKENNLNINNLNNKLCYSFVLQHPENRIVVSFNKPNLYLIGVYEIKHISSNIYVTSYDINDFKQIFNDLSATIKFPKIYTFNKYSDLINKYCSMNTPYDILGVVIHNKTTGDRTKIRNPVYEEVKSLRGNQPKLQYQYLCLRKEGKVKNYLKYYPENKYDFSTYREQIHLFTNNLYNNYISCYIKKEKPLIEFNEEYRTHMFNIHQFYINELREKHMFITNKIVQNYVNKLHPSLLMHTLNYHMHKKNMDN